MSNFACQHCNRVFDWTTRKIVIVDESTEVKSIGNRYCNAEECMVTEAEACGVPVEQLHRGRHDEAVRAACAASFEAKTFELFEHRHCALSLAGASGSHGYLRS